MSLDLFNHSANEADCPQSLYAALAKANEIFLIFCPKYRNCGTRMSRKARGWARMAHRGRFRPLP